VGSVIADPEKTAENGLPPRVRPLDQNCRRGLPASSVSASSWIQNVAEQVERLHTDLGWWLAHVDRSAR
jgi:hypothetical protein